MNVDVKALREPQTQDYKPQAFEPAATPYEEYLQSDFEQGTLSEIFHENTKFKPTELFRFGTSVGFFINDETMGYATAQIDPDYDGRPKVQLPEPASLDQSLEDAIASRRSTRDYSGQGLSTAELSTLLGHSFGTTGDKQIGTDPQGEPVHQAFRAYPSGGGLYPVEQYVAVLDGEGDLAPGWYFYNNKGHYLRSLDGGDGSIESQLDEVFMRAEGLDDAAAVIVMTASFARSHGKYGDRGYRHILQEVGYAGQNLLLVAEAMGLGALPYDSFNDRSIEGILGLDGVNEAPITTIIVGQPEAER